MKKKELIEWAAILSIGAVLYFTGYHTVVIGKLQSLVVQTGLLQPNTTPEGTLPMADYRLQFRDAAGNPHQLEEFRNQTIFINFWATWCPPCIAEMPDIHRLYKEVGEDVVFVMVSIDQEAEKAFAFADRKGYEFPIYHLEGNIPKSFSSGAIPTTFIVATDGRIVVKKEGMAKYNSPKFRAFLRSL